MTWFIAAALGATGAVVLLRAVSWYVSRRGKSQLARIIHETRQTQTQDANARLAAITQLIEKLSRDDTTAQNRLALQAFLITSRNRWTLPLRHAIQAQDLTEGVQLNNFFHWADSDDRPVPDLLEITEDQDTGAAVRQLSVGFDSIFRKLGPPPEGLAELEPVRDSGGGTER